MQQEPERDPPCDVAPLGDDALARRAPAAPSARLARQSATAHPTTQELEAALLAHRQHPHDVDCRNTLLVLLHRSVAAQARDLVARQFRSLAHREDELVLRTLARIEQQGAGDKADENRLPQLLAEYEFGPGARAIYNYVLQKTSNIARNMQVEAYVPDGGFRSTELKAHFKALRMENPAGQPSTRDGTQIEVPFFSPGDGDDPDSFPGRVPEGLQISETPLRQSFLRVNSLARKLDALAQDMVGKMVLVRAQDAVPAEVRLTVNHQRIWRAWLGLSHPELIDLAEEELAPALGVSKASVTRDTSLAFDHLLQHPELRSLLVLMEPNRYQSSASAAKELGMKLDELEQALRGRNGKSFFRKCVHQWLGEHV